MSNTKLPGELPGELPEVLQELCSRLHRETNAEAVLVLSQEGEILGHAGSPGGLEEAMVEAIGDATVDSLARASADPEADGQVCKVGGSQLCAAPLGTRAVLVVVFGDETSLGLVRLRMKRARELILRSFEAT